MINSFRVGLRVRLALLLSSALLVWITTASAARAHEVLPAVADMTRQGDQLVLDIRMNLESFVAGIDQAEVTDTNEAAQAATYDALRALDPAALQAAFAEYWPEMADRIALRATDGAPLPLTLEDVAVPEDIDPELSRMSEIRISAALPPGTQSVSFGWAREFGAIVVRQLGVDAPYDGYLEPGASTPAIALGGGSQVGGMMTFLNYIPVGFDHIVPKGLDHILFVLGLFFLSTRFRPLLWQVTAFTLAHTITLALAALGIVNVPGSIVEPLIAASIVYVAIENLFTTGLSRWRPFVIFGFGLLHGLGFASVLAEFGLPEGSFIPALIGFNIGVEIGQLAVIAIAWLCVNRAIDNSETGDQRRDWAALYLVAMVAVVALLIPLQAAPGDVFDAMLPLVFAVGGLLGLSAASCAVPRFDGYREIVAMPASIAIALVATYWCIERVFL